MRRVMTHPWFAIMVLLLLVLFGIFIGLARSEEDKTNIPLSKDRQMQIQLLQKEFELSQARLAAAQAQMENAQLKFQMVTKELDAEAAKMAGGYKFDPQQMSFVKIPAEKPKEQPAKTAEKKP